MMKQLNEEAIEKFKEALRLGFQSFENGTPITQVLEITLDDVLFEAREAERDRTEQIVEMINRRIDIYMSDAGVKMGYGLAYQVLSELRQELKEEVSK